LKTTIKLRGYQEAGVDFVEAQRRGIVILGVGKGKTEIALRGAERLRCKTLVVCTKSLVKQWETVAKDRLPFFMVVPFSQLERRYADIVAFEPELCVVDEPKPLKSYTRVFELMERIRPRRRLILDATPIENKLDEAWFLFRWLKPKLFGSLENFRSMFVTSNGRYKNMNKFRELIAPHVYRPKTAEPRDRKFYHLRVDPVFSEIGTYEYMELCQRLHSLLKVARKKKSLRAVNMIMGKISKLRSLLGDPSHGGLAKYRALAALIKANPKRRGVIFVYKRDTAKMITKKLRGLGYAAETFDGGLSTKKREAFRTGFNEGTIQFLVATCAGERGLDLPTGNLIVHFDLPWTRASYDQRDRISRLSSDQSEHSLIVTIILKDTVEEIIWSIIAAKRKLMIEPFDSDADDLVIHRKSWYDFLTKFLKMEDDDGSINEETGEGFWFSRGERSHR
jgi:SNF2 family DNA or RNA helicase